MKKIVSIATVILAVISISLLMASPVLAGDSENGDEQSVQPTLDPEQQYEALQHGQSGSPNPIVADEICMTCEEYAASLVAGVVPEEEFAEQMQQLALQKIKK